MTLDAPTPEQELASAYMDGDVTAVERARVEATPELRALVATMRDAATLMAAVPAVDDAVRDAAIAAALDEFGAGSNVVSLASRRRWPNRVLTAAAAVVLVGVVGITVLRSPNNDKSDSASRQQEPKFETNTAEDAVGAGVPDTGAGETAGSEILALPAPIVIDDPQELLALPFPAQPPTADGDDSTATSTGSATTAVAATVPASERVESYNVDALACMNDDQVFLADIIYQGAPAIAVRDTVTGVTEAIDGDCIVLASVSP